MILVIGLGNPGKKYKNTPHNLGFEVVSAFQKENGFPGFKMEKKLEAEISRGMLGDKEVLLAKPQTFMNESGIALKKIIENWTLLDGRQELRIGNLFVVHDDLDLPLGKIKLCFGKGSAGHKGVQSIIDQLQTKAFYRLRIGIKNHALPAARLPARQGRQESRITNYELRKKDAVLKPFTRTEQKIVAEAIITACSALKLAILHSPQKAMAQFN